MKALTFHGKETIFFETIPDPELQLPQDAIIEVKACAICGSDLHVYHERETGCDHGTAMGHEFTGVVVEVGREVRTLRVGDRVISPFTTSCGNCFYCRRGLTSRCEQSQLFGWRENGTGLHGGQAQWVRVPLADGTLLKAPEGLSDPLALLLGDILSTGYFCAEQAQLHPQETLAVVGCGPVGLMAIWAAQQLGAQQIFALDGVPERLAQAQAWGAQPLNYLTTDAVARVREATAGRGADAVLEAVGSSAAIALAMELLRPGGTLSSVGVCTAPTLPFSPTAAYNKNLTYRVGRCPARYYLERLLPAAQAAASQLESIFSHHLPLHAGVDAYELFAQRAAGCTKILLYPHA